jgi:hypothetical protein
MISNAMTLICRTSRPWREKQTDNIQAGSTHVGPTVRLTVYNLNCRLYHWARLVLMTLIACDREHRMSPSAPRQRLLLVVPPSLAEVSSQQSRVLYLRIAM